MTEPLANCAVCHRNRKVVLAVWMYAPCDGKGDIFFCDDHVPRGCSCNAKDYDLPPFHPENEEKTDENGRLLPCVEYWYDDDGFSQGLEN